jgi:hypothetical protein
MNSEEEILNTGTFYWFKSQHRGKVAVPLHYLTDEQKKTLRVGLASNRYEQCNPYHYFTAHYMWFDNNRGYFLVTDFEISSEIKRILSPSKPVRERPFYRVTLSDMKRLLNALKHGEVDEIYVKEISLLKFPVIVVGVKKNWYCNTQYNHKNLIQSYMILLGRGTKSSNCL